MPQTSRHQAGDEQGRGGQFKATEHQAQDADALDNDEPELALLEIEVRTSHGKTWCARVVGRDSQYGLRREFVKTFKDNTSRTGKTGSKIFALADGLYETQDGRRGRRYWRVANGKIESISYDDVLAGLRGGATAR